MMVDYSLKKKLIMYAVMSISLGSRACETARSNARRLPGAFVPKCRSDGTFEQKQCHSSTGHCWCVDSAYGNEIKGSKKGPGEGEVVCGMNNFTSVSKVLKNSENFFCTSIFG